MIVSYKKLAVLGALLLGGVPALSACDFYEEGHLNPSRVEVKSERFMEEIPVAEMDAGKIAGIAQHYHKYGDGLVELTVTYDPASKAYTAAAAGREVSRIVQGLKNNGVRNVQPGILPVGDQASSQLALISYTSYTAHAPKDCDVLPGLRDTDIRVEPDYRLGCTIETVFARQIARPKDLKGRPNEDLTTDGRRSANIVEIHRTGVPNEPLGGESSSGN